MAIFVRITNHLLDLLAHSNVHWVKKLDINKTYVDMQKKLKVLIFVCDEQYLDVLFRTAHQKW